MATLQVTFNELRRMAGHENGYTRNIAIWNTSQKDDVEECLINACRMVYYPGPAGEQQPPHQWSFLKPIREVTFTGVNEVTLPADFVRLEGGLSYKAVGTYKKVQVVGIQTLLNMRINNAQTGSPAYVAVYPSESVGTSGQQWKMAVYPSPPVTTPATSIVFYYRSVIDPLVLTESAPYPLGGASLSAVFGAAVMAACEQFRDGSAGVHTARFNQLLAGAIEADKKITEQERASYPIRTSSITNLQLALADLMEMVGDALYNNPNYYDWSHEEERRGKELLNAALRMAYYPPPVMEGQPPYQWSFMSVRRTLTLSNNNYEYTLPTDFAQLDGPIQRVGTSSTYKEVEMVDIGTIDQLRANSPKAGDVAYAAVTPIESTGTAEQTWRLTVYPTPNATMSVSYRCLLNPLALTDQKPYPLGGPQMSAVLEGAIKAAAEQIKTGQEGAATGKFKGLLAAAIERDKRTAAREKKETWPIRTSTGTLDVTYFDLQEECGLLLAKSADSSTWTFNDVRKIENAIQAGCRTFYSPPILPNETSAHRWSFLTPKVSLATAAGQGDYDLPEDFGGFVDGLVYESSTRIYHHVTLTSAMDILSARSGHETWRGPPQIGAVRPTESDGDAAQEYELILFPTPDGIYTLVGHYHHLMAPLTSEKPYPYGGREHGNTILLACLAEAEKYLPFEERRNRWEDFMRALATSVSQDRRHFSPKRLGFNAPMNDDIEALERDRVRSVTYVGGL